MDAISSSKQRIIVLLLVAATAFVAAHADAAPSSPPEGRYVLPADDRLFPGDVVLEFHNQVADNGPAGARTFLGARIIALPGTNDSMSARCTGCPAPAANQPLLGMKMISGLRAEGGEYVLGRIIVPSASAAYRCKLWQRDDTLFLRIYEPHHYSTHQLHRAATE